MAKKKIPPIVKQVMSKTIPDIDYTREKVISHSQISMYDACPHRWKLQYKDKIKPFSGSIHFIFGTAVHYAIQTYLDVMHKVSKVKADSVGIVELFKDKFREEYLLNYKKNKDAHFSSAEEMREFYEDGEAILKQFQNRASIHFSKREYTFIGVEMPISMAPLKTHPTVKYIGYLDLVFYSNLDDKFLIIDIKTSTRSWGDYQKKDFQKISQLILYKKYFAQQYGVDEKNIDVEFFILKRKLYEDVEFAQKRIQIFKPAAGKNNTNKATLGVEKFIGENFTPDGVIKDKIYVKKPGDFTCNHCPFKDDAERCDKKVF